MASEIDEAGETGETDEEVTAIALGGSEAGSRLDRFLVNCLGVSRSQARALLASGAVSLAGRTLGYGDKGLSLPGEGRLEIARFRKPADQRARPAEEVAVLAEGPGWLAVDKPAGAPVHPLSEEETGTVLNALVARHPEIHGVGEGGLRSGVLHRLDVDTSGVLLFASEAQTWERLRAAFREHRVEKSYRAIVAGAVPESETRTPMSFELAVARHRPARVRVVDESWSKPGRSYPARQEVEVLERFGSATLLEVRIETGFLHQIRVILSHLGHPVLGDALYGEPDSLELSQKVGAERQMLHAARIRYEEIEAASPDPADFAGVLERLRGSEQLDRQQEESCS
jgi:23S rRNA pseudouridine1911/1915/1917 synthase